MVTGGGVQIALPKETSMQRVVRFSIFFLVLITATIHLFLAFPAGLLGFYLISAGFYLIAITYANPGHRFNRDHVVVALRIWTIATLVLWLLLGDRSLIAFLDKVADINYWFVVGRATTRLKKGTDLWGFLVVVQ
jgi:hypothetical protein